MAENVNNKLNLFKKIIHDFDSFSENRFRREKDLKIDKVLIEVFKEISASEHFRLLLLEKVIKRKKDVSKPRGSIIRPIYEQEKLLLQNEFLNLRHVGGFNQTSFKTVKRFVCYENERGIILDELVEAIFTVSKR